jgi:hypothetical protein
MNYELPIATATVRFEQQPITGSQLARLVQAVAGLRGNRFLVDVRYLDGYVVALGHDSDDSDEDVRIVPRLDGTPFFGATDLYKDAKVTSPSYGNSLAAFAIDRKPELVIKAVTKCAADLTKLYEETLSTGSLPDYFSPRQ